MAGGKPETEAAEAERQRIVGEYPVGEYPVGDAQPAGEPGEFDRLARLAAEVCETPIGHVSIVESQRERFIGRHGIALTEAPREWSFCERAMRGTELFEVTDASVDERFAHNPLVTGTPDIRFYAGQPLRSPEGLALGALCVVDTSPRQGLAGRQRDALDTLGKATVGLLERGRVQRRSDRAEALSRSTIADLEQRFQILADAMPQLVWGTPPDGMPDYFNSGWCDYTGEPADASYGVGWLKFLHPDDVPATADAWMKAVTTAGIYDLEYRLRRHDGEYRWMLTRGLPLRAPDGSITRWIGTCTDVHAQREASERLDLLTRELSHRIKNIFAVIGGLIALTTRRHREFESIGKQLQQRVLALGRAHDFVRPRGDPSLPSRSHSSLQGMLEALLAPYGGSLVSPVSITGPDVQIDDRSATPLALYFHELATNSAKYGSLSSAGGRVEITISVGDNVRIEWSEIGGAPPAPGAERGFGANLVEVSITRQLSGTIEHEWRPEGLWICANVPLPMMRR